MISLKALLQRFSRLRRSTLFRSPAHILPATSVLLVVLLSIISFFLPASGSARKNSSGYQLFSSLYGLYDSLGIPYEDEFGLKSADDSIRIEEGETGLDQNIQTRTVQKGDSIYSILKASGLSEREAHEFSLKLRDRFSIKDFKPGKVYEIEYASNGGFSSLSWRQDRTAVLHLDKDENTGELQVWKETLQSESRIATLHGTLTRSMDEEMRRRGRPALSSEIRKLLSSKIDPDRNEFKGGTYRLLYEEQWIDNEFMGVGKILAIEISTGKRKFQAYRFTDSNGRSAYYDERGVAIQNDHRLIEPCNYNRVSSTFGYRTHPIRRTVHFHGGVDFAAPLGTPVKAVADGRVIFRGRKGGAGNMVTIAHGDGMHTQYLHLSRFSSMSGFGKRVQQGDIIGYVGSTGSSTGPHLDFRVVVNGRLQNPLASLRTPAPKQRLAPEELGGLLAKIDLYQSQLDNRQFRVASVAQRQEVFL